MPEDPSIKQDRERPDNPEHAFQALIAKIGHESALKCSRSREGIIRHARRFAGHC